MTALNHLPGTVNTALDAESAAAAAMFYGPRCIFSSVLYASKMLIY